MRVIRCPGIALDGAVCEAKPGFGDCSLCRAHVEYWETLPSSPVTLPPSQVAEIYQVDRVLYDYGITLVPPEDLQRYVNDLRETVCDTAPPDYTLSNGSLNGSCKCISLVKKKAPSSGGGKASEDPNTIVRRRRSISCRLFWAHNPCEMTKTKNGVPNQMCKTVPMFCRALFQLGQAKRVSLGQALSKCAGQRGCCPEVTIEPNFDLSGFIDFCCPQPAKSIGSMAGKFNFGGFFGQLCLYDIMLGTVVLVFGYVGTSRFACRHTLCWVWTLPAPTLSSRARTVNLYCVMPLCCTMQHRGWYRAAGGPQY